MYWNSNIEKLSKMYMSCCCSRNISLYHILRIKKHHLGKLFKVVMDKGVLLIQKYFFSGSSIGAHQDTFPTFNDEAFPMSEQKGR